MNPVHEKWMHQAIMLAEKGRFTTSPNPMVGAVVVSKGRIVGKGYHQRYGGDHAEVIALKHAGKKARGASLYVTLEPCSTWGKTPPCVSAIVQAGIKEVLVGSLDPNPRHHKRGMAALKKEKIRVLSGILEREVEMQNEAFFKYIRTGLPFVTLKMAQSLDGKIATSTGKSRWISSPPSRNFVHRLRAEQDAILVGKKTLLLDNPKLSPLLKVPYQIGKPWRIALDPDFNVRPNARIFEGDQLSFIAVAAKKIKTLAQKKNAPRGAALLPVKEIKGRLDMKDLFKKLGSLGVAKLLVEGGGELAWSILNQGLVDRAFWIIAPKVIGGREAKTSVEGKGFADPNRSLRGRISSSKPLGEDWLLESRF